MEIFVRDYLPADDPQLVEVFRDSHNSLRMSRGGDHPDEVIDEAIRASDEQILHRLKYGKTILVAEVRGTGELAGMGGFASRWRNDLIKSSFGANLYVKESFQRGKAGVSVGTMIRRATLDRLVELGFRKLYGFSTSEAIDFHKRFGANFNPKHNKEVGGVTVHYYEIELRDSILNRIRFEPYLFELSSFSRIYVSVLDALKGGIQRL